MPRNRKLTEAKILEAAIELLANHGFEAWGVNRICREAGVDKVLLYRYYHSLEGLLQAVVESTEFWPAPSNLPDDSIDGYLSDTLSRLRVQPHAWVLLTHPPLRKEPSAMMQRFEEKGEIWLRKLNTFASTLSEKEALRSLPAHIMEAILRGEHTVSTRYLREFLPDSLFSPKPLQHSDPEELPVELL